MEKTNPNLDRALAMLEKELHNIALMTMPMVYKAHACWKEYGAEYDFCLAHIQSSGFIFGGTNRVYWSPELGWRVSDSHCSKEFYKFARIFLGLDEPESEPMYATIDDYIDGELTTEQAVEFRRIKPLIEMRMAETHDHYLYNHLDCLLNMLDEFKFDLYVDYIQWLRRYEQDFGKSIPWRTELEFKADTNAKGGE